MCGIVGIAGTSLVNTRIYDALTVLQHRGQDAAGIATTAGGQIFLRKDNGLVRDVFHTRHMRTLVGNLGIGHVRYPTAGTASWHEAQPFYVNSPYGIALGHNGNLTNADVLKRELRDEARRHLNTSSDSEILLNVFAHELSRQVIGRLEPEHVFAAVEALHRRCEGAYATVAIVPGFGLVAFRGKYGIRPLCYGLRDTPDGPELMVASESVAIAASDFRFVADVKPGEALVFDVRDRTLHTRRVARPEVRHPCLFEFVYFARPDSIMDGISVYKSRLRMGDSLARKILKLRPDHDIDVVIPVPDTSRTAALQVAYHLGVKLREGFIKNRYIGRTFIMPGQAVRRKSVRQKLSPISLEFRDKHVLLVDDSIVRGTTCKEIIRMARDAGARSVSFASAAPPVRYPNVYGIDMPAAAELIAHQRTETEIQDAIGADWLIYQDLDDLVASARDGNPEIETYEDSVFSGQYVTGNVTPDYLLALEASRNDAIRADRDAAEGAALS
ncbi:MAG: amidophosphoribosyltransferase [Deltaproteobacteria bacterium]|nr:amidophosphoribosyltransferase [Deltaproteobacteria bacterium]HCH61660.1 amidophosphoribosyltransferase [Deltaproteobacteria bacterium]